MAEPAWIERAQQDAERACCGARWHFQNLPPEMASSPAAVRGWRSQGWRSPPGLSERSRMRSERAAELDGISKICPRKCHRAQRPSEAGVARDGGARLD